MQEMKYSVIAPLYNEEENAEPLVKRLSDVMEKLNVEFELLLINDGSSDGTLARLLDLVEKYSHLRVVAFKENRGQTVALQAGFDFATGDRVITIDGDLEKDPKYIGEMIEKLEGENLDLVYFQKLYQSDVPWVRRFASRIANRFRQAIIGDKAVDVGSTFIVFRENYLKGRNYSSGFHRFFIGFLEAEGKAIGHVTGPVHNREFGETKYTSWGRLKQGLCDLFYFYLYRNRKIGLPKVVMVATGVTALFLLLPVGATLKAIAGAFAIVAAGSLLMLLTHAGHLMIQQKRTPYKIKGVWPAENKKEGAKL